MSDNVNAKQHNSGRPRAHAERGRNYTVYLTPSEKKILDYLGIQNPNPLTTASARSGLSNGIRFLLKFFAEHVNGNGNGAM